MNRTRIAIAAALVCAMGLAHAQVADKAAKARLADANAQLSTIRTGKTPAAARKVWIVQLAGAPLATYAGGVPGIAATQPAKGARLNARSSNSRAYMGVLDARRNAVIARLPAQAKVLHTYGVAFNGFAAQMTDTEAQSLMTSTDVLSVIESEVRKPDTTRTSDFLGLTATGGIWSQLDAQARNVKGEDVIIGVIDGGIWPENPSFGDKLKPSGEPAAYFEAGTPAYGPAPAGWAGICQTGEGFTAAMCGNKLIGARFFSAAFLGGGAVLTANEYVSPRDGDGHGSHTASTSGGNSNVRNATNGVVIGVMSGIAPRARIAVYKVCWNATVSALTGCYTADTLGAIDAAVADGVDVINYSVSGTQTDFTDPVEIAYLNATAAGVFVAASAGNSGPGNEVAHISPWIATVGASSHDRNPGASLTLGNGDVYFGGSTNFANAPTATMVLSEAIPAAGQTAIASNTCLANSLDAAAAAGKIVVCDRGTNSATARLAASAEVKRVGGVGMVLLNPTTTALGTDAHTVPTVQLPDTVRSAVRSYVTAAAPSGTISLSFNLPGVVAPVMASFSSRGPNKGNGNILKPDITGPGSSVIASVSVNLSAANHAALVAGTYTPPSGYGSKSGTSMSSPHMAGAAALVRQLHPTWTPAAVKSALMTSTTEVKLSNGASDTNRWGYGAGHMNPNGTINPGLVYDATSADYARFMCGLDLTPPSGLGSCSTLGKIAAWNLNLASLTAANVVVSRTLIRTVTNVGTSTATFAGSASLPGWDVVLTPASLTLAPGASASFSAALTRTTAPLNTYAFGSLSWNDGVRDVRSPLTASAVALATPQELTDVRPSGRGTKVFAVESSYTGSISLAPVGLVPATRTTNTVAGGGKQCYNFVVEAGVQFARFQLFNSETTGGASTDLDLEVFNGVNGTGTSLGTSTSGSSDEVVTIESPPARTYSACVAGFAVPAGGATYTLSSWIVGPGSGEQTLRAAGPASVYERGGASIALAWNVAAGQRYMGNLQFRDGAGGLLGATKVFVDNR